MLMSLHFGRHFWIDDENDFKSCPTNIDGTADLENWDYVCEWTDWEGVNYEKLFNVHQACVVNKHIHNNSLNLDAV